ncbi:unnamed protein product [Nesidiocoris tenuis]|uniref:Uncharacterized protein n=1 Tax=Nesidiocoris tenuis TaxID=355587 RepID=A0A6H5H9K8_9HEMI|nr:unnamed protein product [Nesidiocoris tenuis]
MILSMILAKANKETFNREEGRRGKRYLCMDNPQSDVSPVSFFFLQKAGGIAVKQFYQLREAAHLREMLFTSRQAWAWQRAGGALQPIINRKKMEKYCYQMAGFLDRSVVSASSESSNTMSSSSNANISSLSISSAIPRWFQNSSSSSTIGWPSSSTSSPQSQIPSTSSSSSSPHAGLAGSS